HGQRHGKWARGEGVIGKFALARQNFGAGIEERPRRHGDARAGASHGAVGRGGVDVLLLLGLRRDRRNGNRRHRDHRNAEPSRVTFHIHGAPHSIPSESYTSFVSALITAAGTAATPSAGVSKFPLSAIREDRLRFQPLGHKIFRKSPLAREKTTNKEGPPCSHVGISSRRRAPDLRSPAPVSAAGRSRQRPLSICPLPYRRGDAAT